MLLVCSLITTASCKPAPPKLELGFTVIDHEGDPVKGALVHLAGNIGLKSGGKGKSPEDLMDTAIGKSDESGKVLLSIKYYNYFGSYVKKNGYYKTVVTNPNVVYKNGQWNPTPAVCKVTLKPIKKPVPMYVKRVYQKIQKPEVKYGYDLVMGDWVKPYGVGEKVDFHVTVEGYWNSVKDNDSTLTILFENKHDGAILYDSKQTSKGSGFKSRYHAPQQGYKNLLSWRQARKGARIIKEPRNNNASYYLRFRTELNEDGTVKSAFYGKIYGEMKFGGAAEKGTYFQWGVSYINPVVNDRNVEFDPKKNLFKDTAQTFAP